MVASNSEKSNDSNKDSGATDHMSHNREWFVEYQQFEEELPVRIGNGKYIYAKCYGIIDILAYDAMAQNGTRGIWRMCYTFRTST